MIDRPSNPARLAWLSPWLLIGSVCLLASILFFLAVKNVNREREFTKRALLSQADVLMRSVEAGTRTGMGMGWGRRQYQTLLEETAHQSGVLFLALATPAGRVVAHSDPRKIGETLKLTTPKPGATSHAFFGGAERRFEVMRSFRPLRGRGRGRCSNDHCGLGGPGLQKELFIVVGLDPAPLEAASRQDVHQTVILFGTMLLVGAAGFISLFWAHNFRQARARLQGMRAFTSTVLNQMPVGMLMTDLGGRIERSNEAACSILKSQDDPQGCHIGDFSGFLTIAKRLKREETVIEEAIECRLSDSASVPLLVNAALIRDSNGLPGGHVYLFSDMSGVRRLEEQLRRSERLAGLGKLAAGVAHEIRNPLSSIKGFATILAGRTRGDQKSREIADTMVQEVERLNRAVTELLNFAKPADINLRRLSCKELIADSLRLIEGDCLQQGVRIESEVLPEDLPIEGDPDLLAQVLLNLYLNGIHAMPEGGTLSLRAFRAPEGVAIVVKDSGTGIRAEHLPHIFDPYFTTKPRGVGLGLANVYKFVSAHGGQIEVQSAPGKGSTFMIRFYTAPDACSKQPIHPTGGAPGCQDC
ncbi:MAG: ATP-binding protein [Syntrophobacteraceae bacterium]|nr:ATP-binding protein [Syntrophobacteraceae bacterium]